MPDPQSTGDGSLYEDTCLVVPTKMWSRFSRREQAVGIGNQRVSNCLMLPLMLTHSRGTATRTLPAAALTQSLGLLMRPLPAAAEAQTSLTEAEAEAGRGPAADPTPAAGPPPWAPRPFTLSSKAPTSRTPTRKSRAEQPEQFLQVKSRFETKCH